MIDGVKDCAWNPAPRISFDCEKYIKKSKELACGLFTGGLDIYKFNVFVTGWVIKVEQRDQVIEDTKK